MIVALLEKAGGMSDEDILARLSKYDLVELRHYRAELLQRRQSLRGVFGHINSPFIDTGSPSSREYSTLVRLTDLVNVATSRKQFETPPAVLGTQPSKAIPPGFSQEQDSLPVTEPMVSSDTRTRAATRATVVKPILEQKGWTQSAFATEAGLDKNTIRDYLNGATKKPRAANRLAMAKALGIDVSEMPK